MNKYDKAMMKTAYIWAEESYCKRRQVGSVLAKDDRIISIGYNGTVSNDKNICEDYKLTCPNCGKETELPYPDAIRVICGCGRIHDYTHEYLEKNKAEFFKSKETVVHAEQNALMFAAKNGIATQGATLYTTTAPCVNCAKLAIQAGITKVVYDTTYKNTDGIDLLEKHMLVIKL